MNRLESELFDLEELLMRNDGIANDDTYTTIVGIANDVSELEEKNAELRDLLADCHALLQRCCDAEDEHGEGCPMWPDHGDDCDLRKVERRIREMVVDE